MISNIFFVGLGGFFGAIMRYLLSLIPIKEYTSFPLITLIINVFGALFIGIIFALVQKNTNINDNLILFLKVGLCGGFTTFSTFSLEGYELISSGKWLMAMTYIVLSVLLSIGAVFLAQIIIKA